METVVLVKWIHLIAVIIWLGGVFFQLAVLCLATCEGKGVVPKTFVKLAMAFRPYAWAAMAVVGASGMMRVGYSGGMKALAPMVHAKIALAIVMLLLGLISTLWMLPKVSKQLETQDGSTTSYGQFIQYKVVTAVIFLLGLVVIYLLAQGHSI